jgi:predicted DNA-binding protein (MmcQ/YjbR family)
MNLDSLRAYCLSFPGATEGLQWGECLLFRVANKIFVNVTLADTPPRVWVKCTPGRCAELLEIEGIRRAPYIGKHDWVELERMDLLRDAEMREVIAESYQNIRSKLPRSVQAKLGEKQIPVRVKSRLGMTKKKKSSRQSQG